MGRISELLKRFNLPDEVHNPPVTEVSVAEEQTVSTDQINDQGVGDTEEDTATLAEEPILEEPTEEQVEEIRGYAEVLIGKDESISNPELRAKLEEKYPGLDLGSPRSFNATYPLQIRRALAEQRGEVSRPKPKEKVEEEPKRQEFSTSYREVLRSELLDLMREAAEADRVRLIDLVTSVEDRVDRLEKALK